MSLIPDFDVPQFFTGQMCGGAGIGHQTLKNWITRDPPALLISAADRALFAAQGIRIATEPHDRLSTQTGRPHLFTFRRVLQAAIVAELSRLGVVPRQAGMLSLAFTDVGDVAAVFQGEPLPDVRQPGELYPTGETFLVARAGESIASVVNIDVNKASAATVFGLLGAGDPASMIVNLNVIDARVRASLGLSPTWAQRKRGK
jgi:hypothetical protein